MCLAIPGKVIDIEGTMGIVDYDGIKMEVRLDLVDVEVGNFVIVHTGFAIDVLSDEDALESIAIWKEIEEKANESQ